MIIKRRTSTTLYSLNLGLLFGFVVFCVASTLCSCLGFNFGPLTIFVLLLFLFFAKICASLMNIFMTMHS